MSRVKQDVDTSGATGSVEIVGSKTTSSTGEVVDQKISGNFNNNPGSTFSGDFLFGKNASKTTHNVEKFEPKPISKVSTIRQDLDTKSALTDFSANVKTLLEEEYKFSIKRFKTDELTIECTSMDDVYGSSDTIEGKLTHLIRSLKSAISSKEIKESQYQIVDSDLEAGRVTIVEKLPGALNKIAELIEIAGKPKGVKPYLQPLTQCKAALFGGKKPKSDSSSSAGAEPASVNCLLQ